MICRVFKKKNLFKITGNEGAASSSHHQAPRTNTFIHKDHDHNPYLLHQLPQHDQHYTQIPVASTLPVQYYSQNNNNIELAQNFMKSYHHEFSSSGADQSAPCESGLEVASSTNNHMNINNDHQWGINIDSSKVALGMGFESNQINHQLPLRGEMQDFWSYGK